MKKSVVVLYCCDKNNCHTKKKSVRQAQSASSVDERDLEDLQDKLSSFKKTFFVDFLLAPLLSFLIAGRKKNF